MNASKSSNDFVPKQAFTPTPQLYDELVGNSMEKLAEASLSGTTINHGFTIHDNGCGTGAGSAAVIAGFGHNLNNGVTIKGTDISEDALAAYRARAKKNGWAAEGINTDSQHLPFVDDTIDLSIWNALVFIIPQNATLALRETYRTLKPGGTVIVNSWAYLPNMNPLQLAAKMTRPPGTPLPRQELQRWTAADLLEEVLVKGGFQKDKISMREAEVFCDTPELTHFATMLWSFIGGTNEAGWLESDEERWDEAIEIIVTELRKTKGFEELADGKARLRFVANIATAVK